MRWLQKTHAVSAKDSMSTQETFMMLPLSAGPNVKHVGIGSTCDIVPHTCC